MVELAKYSEYDLPNCIALDNNDECPSTVYAEVYYLRFLLHKVTKTARYMQEYIIRLCAFYA